MERHAQMVNTISGSFDMDCQAKAVHHSLSALVAMILNGTNIKSQGCNGIYETW